MLQINHYPLISVLVLCYNNQKYINETLTSIFEQTYPNLEVLISDDASRDFNAESLILWINRNRTANVKKIVICENSTNIGTVASLENLQSKSRGEYLLQIAADDTLHNSRVIEDAFRKAVELGDEGRIIMGQAEMWDIDLKNKMNDFVSDDTADFIEKATPLEFFAETCKRIMLPACYLYRRDVLDCVGRLSGHYRLVEDWPTQLRLSRQGIKPTYCRDLVIMKHRDGGISHGNTAQSKRAFLLYYEDILKGYKYEIEPYVSMLDQDSQKDARKYFEDRVRAYYKIHVPNYLNTLHMEPSNSTSECEPINSKAKSLKWLLRSIAKELAYRLSKKKIILLTACAFFFFIILTVSAAFVPGALMKLLFWTFGAFACVSGMLLICELCAKFILRMRKSMWNRYGC